MRQSRTGDQRWGDPSAEPGYGTDLAEHEGSLRGWVLAVYAAYLAGAVTGGGAALLGVIAAYLKRGDARGTKWESHFDNQIRTFWISLLLFMIAFPLSLIFIGWIVWGVMFIYYVWKSVKGAIRAIDRRPYL